MAAKRAQDLSRRVSILETNDLPIDPACLAVVDVLVVSSDCLATDPGGIALVRDWVLGGGHLWIMLDEVQPDTVSAPSWATPSRRRLSIAWASRV